MDESVIIEEAFHRAQSYARDVLKIALKMPGEHLGGSQNFKAYSSQLVQLPPECAEGLKISPESCASIDNIGDGSWYPEAIK